MRTAVINIDIRDDSSGEQKSLHKIHLIRVLPTNLIPADLIPHIVDEALQLLRPLMVKAWTKFRNK